MEARSLAEEGGLIPGVRHSTLEEVTEWTLWADEVSSSGQRAHSEVVSIDTAPSSRPDP